MKGEFSYHEGRDKPPTDEEADAFWDGRWQAVRIPYLLDSSRMIWALENPASLSIPARTALERGSLVVSVVSY